MRGDRAIKSKTRRLSGLCDCPSKPHEKDIFGVLRMTLNSHNMRSNDSPLLFSIKRFILPQPHHQKQFQTLRLRAHL